MPTISGPDDDLHRQRRAAESFGVHAERYDRTRPGYPGAMVERIVAASPGPDMVDVGCGTGVAARQFLDAGCRVLGVEPDDRMAEFARRRGVEVEVATFEDWEPAGRSFDTIIAGTAWHWIDPAAGAAKAASVLRPEGRLAAFWHVYRMPSALTQAFASVFERVLPDSPFNFAPTKPAMEGYEPLFAKAADGIRGTGRFGDPERWHFEWQRYYTRDEWLDQLPTSGVLTRVPADTLAELLDGIGAAIDAYGGGFTLPYTTVVVTAVMRETLREAG